MSVKLCCVSVIGLLYTVHFTAFCSGGAFFPGHGVVSCIIHILFHVQLYERNTTIQSETLLILHWQCFKFQGPCCNLFPKCEFISIGTYMPSWKLTPMSIKLITSKQQWSWPVRYVSLVQSLYYHRNYVDHFTEHNTDNFIDRNYNACLPQNDRVTAVMGIKLWQCHSVHAVINNIVGLATEVVDTAIAVVVISYHQ